MALVALTDDQKEQLRASTKFLPMIRYGVIRKATFWAVTTDPMALPGGQTTANAVRWAKSRSLSAKVLNAVDGIDNDTSFALLFLKNLTQAVWDNVAVQPFAADPVIVNMEANSATMIDAPLDAAFDDKIKYMVF
jgi:hypothetical protein